MKTVWNLLAYIGLFSLFTISMFVAGYETEKMDQATRSPICINSACEHVCAGKPQGRFIRHKGECQE